MSEYYENQVVVVTGAASGIGLAANKRIVIVTEADRKGATNAFDPDRSKALDEYHLDVARRRRRGETAV